MRQEHTANTDSRAKARDNLKAKRLQESIRLFQNPVLEALSHVHPLVPLMVWLPLVAWLLVRALWVHELNLLALSGVVLAGLVTWSLAEYLLHRFLFHFPAKSKLGRWLVFAFHGVHHDSPQDKTRLVMPPVPAALILAVLWLLFGLAVPRPWIEPFMAAFILGYLVYDYMHYATHHFAMRHPVLRFIKRYHMQHHFSSEEGRFGVSSPLWDWVFGTYPRKER